MRLVYLFGGPSSPLAGRRRETRRRPIASFRATSWHICLSVRQLLALGALAWPGPRRALTITPRRTQHARSSGRRIRGNSGLGEPALCAQERRRRLLLHVPGVAQPVG